MKKKIIIFGAGRAGKRCYNQYGNKYDIVCFTDNDPARHGSKYMSLDIISPNLLPELNTSVLVATHYRFYIEIMEQLYNLGINEFYISENKQSDELTLISKKKNKISVMRQHHACTVATGLINNNPYKDIEVVSINGAQRDSDFCYHYMTSSLIITQFGEHICDGIKTIELWHGFPIKTLLYMDENRKSTPFAKKMHDHFARKDVICSLSRICSIFIGYCSDIEYDKFCITGYPRNDMLFKTNGIDCLQRLFGDIRHKHIIIYLPTYRGSDKFEETDGEDCFINNMQGYDEMDFDNYLQDNNILFIYKLHHIQYEQELFTESNNIKKITDAMLFENNLDLYEILNATDCLISDYSSVVIDYLLLDRPVILASVDLKEYSATRGLMVEPYDAWMPGDIVFEYIQLKDAITNAIFGVDNHKKNRERMRNITHYYKDGNSSERVLSLAREMLEVV